MIDHPTLPERFCAAIACLLGRSVLFNMDLRGIHDGNEELTVAFRTEQVHVTVHRDFVEKEVPA